MSTRSLSVALVLIGFAAAVASGAWNTGEFDSAAAAEQQTTRKIVFDYDCTNVPWRCEGARREMRWQAWEVRCPPSGCVWRWLTRANPGEEIELGHGGYYRLWFGEDNDYGDIASYWLEDAPTYEQIYLDAVYLCSRNPFLCDGDNAWQLYSCDRNPDGSCAWEWHMELVGNMTGVFALLDHDDWLLYWGLPRGRVETPMPSPTSTVTPTPSATSPPTVTPTPSRTPTPSDTPQASATGITTSRPTETETAAPTVAPSSTATPEDESVIICLPRASRGQ